MCSLLALAKPCCIKSDLCAAACAALAHCSAVFEAYDRKEGASCLIGRASKQGKACHMPAI